MSIDLKQMKKLSEENERQEKARLQEAVEQEVSARPEVVTSTQGFEEEKIEVSQDDIIEFYDRVIMRDEPFYKTYEMKGPSGSTIELTLRTRTSAETKIIVDRLSSLHNAGTLNFVHHMNDNNLAFSLVKLGDKEYDGEYIDVHQELNKRLNYVIDVMQAPKKQILWDRLSHFDQYVKELTVKSVNF